MRFVCRTCGVVREAEEQPSQHPSEVVCSSCGAAMAPEGADPRPAAPRSRAVALGLNEQWFVMPETGDRQGPYPASQIARLLEQGLIGWNSQIWREGLKGWRPARRDDLLVFAVASARGMASDTSRVDMLAEILQDDTFVQDEPPAALPRASEHAGAGEGAAAARPLSQAAVPEATSATPPPTPEPPAPPSHAESSSKRPSWLLRYSTPIIAVLAFASGVLLTQLSRRIGALGAERDTGASRERSDGGALHTQLAGVVSPVPEAPAGARAPGQHENAAGSGLRAQPEAGEVEAELARLAPSVRRCARRLGALELEVVIDGPSGRAKPTQLHAKGLRAGKLACVAGVLDAIRVAPFRDPVFRLAHRYRW